mgnify:CR=1 FL=1
MQDKDSIDPWWPHSACDRHTKWKMYPHSAWTSKDSMVYCLPSGFQRYPCFWLSGRWSQNLGPSCKGNSILFDGWLSATFDHFISDRLLKILPVILLEVFSMFRVIWTLIPLTVNIKLAFTEAFLYHVLSTAVLLAGCSTSIWLLH